MISIELWRARIGGWRGSAKSAPAAGRINPDLLIYLCKFMAALLITILLIIGGIELNPGPPKKATNSSSDDDMEISCPQGMFFI